MSDLKESDQKLNVTKELYAKDAAKAETIIKLAILDKTFRNRLIANPKEVFDEVGIVYPAEYKFIVVELEANTVPILLPPYEGKD